MEINTTIIKNERPDSINLSTTAKGDITWDVKVYGDTATAGGLDDMTKRIEALKVKAMKLAEKPAA